MSTTGVQGITASAGAAAVPRLVPAAQVEAEGWGLREPGVRAGWADVISEANSAHPAELVMIRTRSTQRRQHRVSGAAW
jgi:hypothetical protein